MGIGLIELNTSGILSIGDYEEAYDSGYLQYESYINTGKLSIIKSDYFIGSDWYLENLRTLEMPNVKLIQTDSLFGLFGSQVISLDTVIAPNLLGISGQAFLRCPNLKELNLPQLKALTSPLGCTNLETLYIQNCSYIEQSTLNMMSQLSSIDLRACTNLYDLPPNISYISLYAFSTLSGINFSYISNHNLTVDFINVTYIDRVYISEVYALNFPKCVSINFGDSNWTYGHLSADYEINLPLVSYIHCPYSTQSIGIRVPIYAKRIILNNMSECWSRMFNPGGNNTILEYIEMNKCQRIYADAFGNCIKLSRIYFPNVSYIEHSMLYSFRSADTHYDHEGFTIDSTYYNSETRIFDVSISLPKLISMHTMYNQWAHITYYGNVWHINELNIGCKDLYLSIGGNILGLPISMKLGSLKNIYVEADYFMQNPGQIVIPYSGYSDNYFSKALPILENIYISTTLSEYSTGYYPIVLQPDAENIISYGEWFPPVSNTVYGINYDFPNLTNIIDYTLDGTHLGTIFVISKYEMTGVCYNQSSTASLLTALTPTTINLPKLLNGHIWINYANSWCGPSIDYSKFILNDKFSGSLTIQDHGPIYNSNAIFNIPTDIKYLELNGVKLNSITIKVSNIIEYYNYTDIKGYIIAGSIPKLYFPNLINLQNNGDSSHFGGPIGLFYNLRRPYDLVSAPNLELITEHPLSTNHSSFSLGNISEIYAPKLSSIVYLDSVYNSAFHYYGFHVSKLTIGFTNIDRTGYSFAWTYSERDSRQHIINTWFSLEYLSMSMCSNLMTNAFLYVNIQELYLERCENLDIYNTRIISGEEVSHYYKNTRLTMLSLPSLKTLGNIDVFTRLQNITLPECISISDNAMYGNSIITYLSLPKAEYIGSMALPNSLRLLRLSGYFSDGHGTYIGRQPFNNAQGVLQVPASLYTYYRTNYYSSMFTVMYYGNIESGDTIPYAYYIDSEHHYMEYYSEGDDLLHPSGFVPSYSDFTFIGYASTSNLNTSTGYTPLSSKVASPFDIRNQWDVLYGIFYKSNSFDMYDYQTSYTISGDGYFNNNDVISPVAMFDQIGYSGYEKLGWTNVSDNYEPIVYSNSSYYILNVLESSLYAVYSKSISMFYNLKPGGVRYYQSGVSWRSADYINGPIENIYHHGLSNLMNPVVDLFSDFVSENVKTVYYNTTVSCWTIDSSYYMPGVSYSMYESTYARLGVLADEYIISNNSINYQISIPEQTPLSETKSLMVRNLSNIESYSQLYYDVFVSGKYSSYFDSDPHLSYLVTISNTIDDARNLNKYFDLVGPPEWYRNKKCIFDLMLYAKPMSSFDISYLMNTPITYIIANDSYIYSSTIIFDSSHYSNGIFEYNIGQISLPLLASKIYAYATNYSANIYVTEWPSNDVERDNRCFLNIKNMRIVNQDDSPIIF